MMYKGKVLISLIALSMMMALLPFAVSAQITNSVTISSAADLNAYGWPVTISGGTSSNPVVVTLAADIALSDVSNYFIIGGDYVTFDGNNHTVTITGSVYNYPGLIKNGSSVGPVNGYSNITIKNLGVSSTDSLLSNTAGWIGQEGFGYNATNTYIDNCYSNCLQTGTNGGGIVGRYSPAEVANCYSTCVIGSGGGGICGKYFSGTVTNCYSTGVIGTNAGGIMGSFSTGTAINCYSTGNIGLSGGGIMGSDAGNSGSGIFSGATATNCYSRGNITGNNAGGIMSQKSFGTVTNCYSTGNIIGISAGGIVGYLSSANIANCYTIGSLVGSGAGVISGASFAGATSKCISSSGNSWSDIYASTVLTGTDGTVWVGLGLEQPFTLATAVQPEIITQPFSGSICSGSNITVSATGTGTLYYQWKLDGTNIGTDANSITAIDSGTYTVVVTDNVGSVTSDPAVITVTSVPSAPTASDVSICSGNTASLTAAGTGTIDWYDAATGGNNLGSGSGFITPALTVTTIFYAQDSNSCGASVGRTAVTVTATTCIVLVDPGLGNFNALTKTFYDDPFIITPPSSSGTGVFTYVSSNTGVATISGTTVTIVGAGDTAITSTQAGDAIYEGASISATLTVNAVSLLTKNGEITTINPNYINKYGAIGTATALGSGGELKHAKSIN